MLKPALPVRSQPPSTETLEEQARSWTLDLMLQNFSDRCRTLRHSFPSHWADLGNQDTDRHQPLCSPLPAFLWFHLLLRLWAQAIACSPEPSPKPRSQSSSSSRTCRVYSAESPQTHYVQDELTSFSHSILVPYYTPFHIFCLDKSFQFKLGLSTALCHCPAPTVTPTSLSPQPLSQPSTSPLYAITCTSTANSISSPPPPHYFNIPNGPSKF